MKSLVFRKFRFKNSIRSFKFLFVNLFFFLIPFVFYIFHFAEVPGSNISPSNSNGSVSKFNVRRFYFASEAQAFSFARSAIETSRRKDLVLGNSRLKFQSTQSPTIQVSDFNFRKASDNNLIDRNS